jgi:hypothetical protein
MKRIELSKLPIIWMLCLATLVGMVIDITASPERLQRSLADVPSFGRPIVPTAVPPWLTSTRFAGGDDCVSATTISSSSYTDSGDTTGANNTIGNYGLASMPSAYPGPDKFYKLVLATATNVSATMSLTGSTLDGVIYITKTCPAGIGNTLAAANTVTSSQDSIGAGVGPEILPAATLGAGTYYIGIDSFAASGTGSAGTYTLTVTSLAPTAAMVSVGGRVTTIDGRGIRNVAVSLVGPDGSERTVRTSAFGYYRFDEIESGMSYTLTVTSKQYSFAVPSRLVSVGDEITDLDFTAQQ